MMVFNSIKPSFIAIYAHSILLTFFTQYYESYFGIEFYLVCSSCYDTKFYVFNFFKININKSSKIITSK